MTSITHIDQQIASLAEQLRGEAEQAKARVKLIERAEREIRALRATIARAQRLRISPRDNWESGNIDGGGYFVLLNVWTDQRIDAPVAVCQIREDRSDRLDHLQFSVPLAFHDTREQAWQAAIDLAIGALVELAQQALNEVTA